MLKAGLDTVVNVSNNTIFRRFNVAEPYSYLRLTENVQNKFSEYFYDGIGPSAAKAFHEMFLKETDKFEEALANAKVNPTVPQIKNLYNKLR